jgi:NAD(P)-dependent dehydrogenase (short-subunit alcohol dehydrogenase family)
MEVAMTTNECSALKGKRVIVLGGTSGIGIATARAAAQRGAEVIVTSRNAERVEQAARAVGGRGETADLTNEGDAQALFERVGAIDHLVYTAGDELLLGPIAKLDLAGARRAFEVRVFGALAAVKHAVPKMNAGGSIVLTHGIAGRRPAPGWTLGAAVCGAMESITRALAVELAPIRVNAVSPGFVRTPLWSPIPETERELLFREAGRKLLTGRVGEAEEIAEVYCLLMANRFTTGQTIIVDGGGVLV